MLSATTTITAALREANRIRATLHGVAANLANTSDSAQSTLQSLPERT